MEDGGGTTGGTAGSRSRGEGHLAGMAGQVSGESDSGGVEAAKARNSALGADEGKVIAEVP